MHLPCLRNRLGRHLPLLSLLVYLLQRLSPPVSLLQLQNRLVFRPRLPLLSRLVYLLRLQLLSRLVFRLQ